jgi:dienelactone hydrolase
VDLKTGAADIIERGDETTVGWTTDRTGSVSVRYRASFGALVIEGRSPGETAWTQIVRIRAKDLRKEFSDFDILGPGETPGVFYVAVQPKTADDGDTRTVHLYDLRTRKLGPSLWLALPYDIESIVTSDSTNALRGVCYRVDLLQCDFADPVVQANMRGLSKYFGGRKSLSPLSWSDDGRWWLFAATGPDDPGSYYLYDWTNHQVRSLGPAQPKLPPERLADRRPYAFAARDGTRIPGYLTGPAGAKGPLPLVVIPHGGPMVRDDLDFDALAQLIATRGYLVFQPNFRGSGGFGRKWLEAGYHEWGGLMQDDVHDGVKALIAAGLADPARICAFGASYGGYAALIQGALHPETYKCVISWAGIADLARHVRERKSIDGADGEVHLYDLKQIGDPERDKARLSQQSPLTYAGSYGPPVLLLHGADDDTVSADQSREMDKALRKAGRQTRLILVKDEGHPDWGTDDQTSAVREILTFLQAHIAPAAPPAPLPAENLSRPATPAAPTSR